MANNDTSYRQMDSQEAQRRVEEISKKTGASMEESDIDNLARKKPEDRDQFLRDLEAQYQRRAAPTSHRQSDSQSGAYPDVGADPRTEQATLSQPQQPQPAQGGSAMASWLGHAPTAPPAAPDPYASALAQQNSLMQQLFERQVAEQNRIAAEQAAREAELKTRRDALFTQLQGRAQQALTVTPEDPIIKGQVDSYRAEQERALRNLRSDAAEGGAALRPTQNRMAGERVAQGVASMQAELMARELSARRGEIADALSSMGGLLSADQQVGLQRELAGLDSLIRQQQAGISNRELDIRRELGLGDLGLKRELGLGDLGLRRDLGFSELDVQRELGLGGLSNELLRTMLQNQQFYSDLGLRNRTQDDYYDLVRRGRIGNAI